jgi:hypothetical protein
MSWMWLRSDVDVTVQQEEVDDSVNRGYDDETADLKDGNCGIEQ